MKKITIIYGTKPEFIKLYPLILELRNEPNIQLQTIFTGQHRDLLKDIHLKQGFEPCVTLPIQRLNGDLNELVAETMGELNKLAQRSERPDLILVHGDTASAYAAALFAFQLQVPLAHLEAGLRSFNIKSPFPEEFYRQSISKMASFNLVPTKKEFLNLIEEGIDENKIHIVGNTIVDALNLNFPSKYIIEKRVLITLHRRENLSKLAEYLKRLDNLGDIFNDYSFEFIKHPSQKSFFEEYKFNHLKFLNHLDHHEFLSLLGRSSLFITDSGGGQEEASILEVPTLIVRDFTERSDGIGKGIKLTGSDPDKLEELGFEFLMGEKYFSRSPKSIKKSPVNLISSILKSELVYT